MAALFFSLLVFVLFSIALESKKELDTLGEQTVYVELQDVTSDCATCILASSVFWNGRFSQRNQLISCSLQIRWGPGIAGVLLPRCRRCFNVLASASGFSDRSERLSIFVASRFWNRWGGSGKSPEQSAKSPSWQRERKCVSLDQVLSEKFPHLCLSNVWKLDFPTQMTTDKPLSLLKLRLSLFVFFCRTFLFLFLCPTNIRWFPEMKPAICSGNQQRFIRSPWSAEAAGGGWWKVF